MLLAVTTLILLFLGALAIGFISAMSGIGGGSLIVPYMILVLGFDVRVAVATSLVAIIVTSSIAASQYLRDNLVDLKTALTLEPITTVGAILGAIITTSIPPTIIKTGLGFILLYVSISMLLKALRPSKTRENVKRKTKRAAKALSLLVSFFAGILSGMFGIGGGVLKVPIMAGLLGLPIKTAVATSSFMVGLTATGGSIVYVSRGIPEPLAVAALASGIIPGAYIGARHLEKLKPRTVRLIFALIILYAAIRLIISLKHII